MKNNFRNNVGIQKLYKEYQKAFRIPENLNHYSYADFRNAEKKFIKHCFLNGKNELFNQIIRSRSNITNTKKVFNTSIRLFASPKQSG